MTHTSLALDDFDAIEIIGAIEIADKVQTLVSGTSEFSEIVEALTERLAGKRSIEIRPDEVDVVVAAVRFSLDVINILDDPSAKK
jgi:hypothetical protein